MLKILLCVSVILGMILFSINRLTTPNIHWAALANCGIIYIWITVIYAIKKSTNVAGHVLIQTIIISAVTLYIDDRIGFRGWSINIALPIIFIVSNATMLILTIITQKNYIKYAIYQVMIVPISLITMWLIWDKIIMLKVLSYIALGIVIINFLISIILCFRDFKEVIIRKFHM